METVLSGLASALTASSCCARAGPPAATSAAASAVICVFGPRLRDADMIDPPSAAEASRRRLVLGAVAAVDVDVAIHAAARHAAQRGGAGAAPDRQLAGLARMARMAVAFLAQERRALLEQVGDRGAVRLVADGAVFLHRRMVVHERAALLGVAGEAGVVDGVAHQLLRRAAMHVVAGGAGHLALHDRVVDRPVDLRALLLVAVEAGV